MADQYAAARNAAERAIREGLRLAPDSDQQDLWCAMLDRLAEIDKTEEKRNG